MSNLIHKIMRRGRGLYVLENLFGMDHNIDGKGNKYR